MGKRRSTLMKGKRAAGEGANDAPSLRAFSDEPPAWARLAPFLAFLLLLALYLATLCPSVGGGDSGELTAAALTGGVPHPSGYPLFALLARFFAALPLGHSPAWRVNLLSAVPMAAAAGLVCAVVQSWTRNSAAGLLAAALGRHRPPVVAPKVSAHVGALIGASMVGGLLVSWGVRPEPGLRDLGLGILSLGSIGLACAVSIAAVAYIADRHLG